MQIPAEFIVILNQNNIRNTCKEIIIPRTESVEQKLEQIRKRHRYGTGGELPVPDKRFRVEVDNMLQGHHFW